MEVIDLPSWKRKTQYEFFLDFVEPNLAITGNVNVKPLKEYCKQYNKNFTLHLLWISTKVLNDIEEFRVRIQGDTTPCIYNKIDIGMSVLNNDKTFSFCYMDFKEDINEFLVHGRERMDEVLSGGGGVKDESTQNRFFYSFMPWIGMTNIQHPRNGNIEMDSIPKVSIGKYFEQGNKLLLPVDICAHHSLIDAYHIAQYFEGLEREFASYNAFLN